MLSAATTLKRFALCLPFFCLATSLMAFRDDEPRPQPALSAPPAAVHIMPTPAQNAAVRELGFVSIAWDLKTGVPGSIRGNNLGAFNRGGKGLQMTPAHARDYAADAVAVMDSLSRVYRLRDAPGEFRAKSSVTDGLGFRHVRLEQMHERLRVVGAELIVHFDRPGKPYQVSGRYIPGIGDCGRPAIDCDSAVAAARRDLDAAGYPPGILKGNPELVVYAREVSPVLAYELTLAYRGLSSAPGLWRYWVNARNGAIINRFNDIRKSDASLGGHLNSGEGGDYALVTGDASGGYYYLRYNTLRWEIFDYQNNRTCRSAAPVWETDKAARSDFSAAYNFNNIQAYYYAVHARYSFDNAGEKALAIVRTAGGTDNAYWDPDAGAFYFYPGETYGELTVLDVCAHEFTHAVTENTSALVYQNESGALNESFSDIFGALVEFNCQQDGRSAYPGRAAGRSDWLMGEDCVYLSGATALRDMRNPGRYTDPGRYHGSHWHYGSSDNGGVHHNCGVQNHFFYLLCEGGSGTNDGIVYSFTGIGIESARRLAYRALTVYCTPNTDYAAARSAWLSAAQDIEPSLTGAVNSAWAAVGIGGNAPAHASSLRAKALNNDFDGDNAGDYAIYHKFDGRWFVWSSLASDWLADNADFGSCGYLPVPGDYDGDGKTDGVVYSGSAGCWIVFYVGSGTADMFRFGGEECIPAPGDYDGDGKTDFALYNFASGAWFIFRSRTMDWLAYGEALGGAGYLPAAGDYNGGGKSDAAVYSEELAMWLLYYTETGTLGTCDFSNVLGSRRCHIPAPGDYDGDNCTDFALYDYLSGSWYVWSAVKGWILHDFKFADYAAGDYLPVPGDYDGDGRSDLALYSREYGEWLFYYMGSRTAARLPSFGGSDFVPVTGWAFHLHQ